MADEFDPYSKGVEYQVTKVDPTNPETKGAVYQVHKVDEVTAAMSGKFYRARIIKDPSDPTVRGKVYQIVIIDDPDDPSVKGKVFNAIVTGDQEVVVVGPAVPPLDLSDAVANTLTSLKAFGGTGLGANTIPSEYTEVEYVQNAANTLVKTGTSIANSDNFKIDIVATATTSGAYYIFQSRDIVGTTGQTSSPITGISGSVTGLQISGAMGDGNYIISGLTRTNRSGHQMNTIFECVNGNTSLYVKDLDTNEDDTKTGTYTTSDLNRGSTDVCLFGNEATGSGSINRLAANGKVYYAKLWKNGVLALDLVPAKRNSDNAVGLYNRVNGAFLTATEGSLTAGNEVVPTPSDPMDIYCNNGKISVLDHTNWNVITNPTSQTGQGMFISTEGKLQKANDRGAGVFIPVTVGKKYTVLINRKTVDIGTIIRYGQSNNGTMPNSAEQLLDWYRGTLTDGMMISFTAKRPYFVMQLSANLVEATGGIDNSVEVIEAAGDNETIAIRTKNIYNPANDIVGKYIDSSGNIQTADTGVYQMISNVEVGKTYTFSTTYTRNATSNTRIYAYKSDNTSNGELAYKQNTTPNSYSLTFTIPADTAYIGVSHNRYDTETQVELGGTKTAYIAYNDSTATANNLFAINTYKDVQEIITGATTHDVNVYVLKGTETWAAEGTSSTSYCIAKTTVGSNSTVLPNKSTDVICSHYPVAESEGGVGVNDVIWVGGSNVNFKVKATYAALSDWKTYLAAQYAAGTPVIVIVPRGTPFEEVAPIAQSMTVVDGDNTLSLTQQGMTPLTLEATYTQQQ